METIYIDGENLTTSQVVKVARDFVPVEISPEAYSRIDESRAFVEKILDDGKTYYGLNTGFGDFATVRISPGDQRKLQVNLVRSHSAGVGEPLPTEVVRAMMVLRANALCRGHSGIRRKVIEAILKMLNAGVHPVVPSRGSVGASGDLAPLAHIALVLIGEGKAEYKGEVVDGTKALKEAGIEPVQLLEKEGLALINGTQLMSGISCIAIEETIKLLKTADLVGALTVEVLLGTDRSFLPIIQKARPHRGQIESAHNVLLALKDSEIVKSHRDCEKVQDAYSLRCIPAVHGAAREGLRFLKDITRVEINSSVDNPLIFVNEQMVLSGGNFHGAPIALALETLAVSLSFISNISERRTERMVNRHYSGLPAFLAREGGLNSGLMLAQYSAAALASENKILCHPACCDTIPTSAGQEDHVSMGSISGLKLLKILENTWTILAIEALCACEAMEYRKDKKPGVGTGAVYSKLRKKISPRNRDRTLSSDIETACAVIRHAGFIMEIEEEIGKLEG